MLTVFRRTTRMQTGIASVAAAGTVIGNATLLTDNTGVAMRFNVTGADGAKGVKLPLAATNGRTIEIYNASSSVLLVYPGVGDDINDGTANASVSIPGNSWASFKEMDASTWAWSGGGGAAGGAYVTTAGTQTLTNKTLTSPTITTPTVTENVDVAAAAGADQTNATAINTASPALIRATGGNNAAGVKLPTAAAGLRYTVKNDAGDILFVYPAASDAINAAGANNAVSMAANTSAVFSAYNDAQWYTTPLVPS